VTECVHEQWTQFWAVPTGDGRWRIMYASRSGARYVEKIAAGTYSEADALAVLGRTRGTR
jgi:hypothetical protein